MAKTFSILYVKIGSPDVKVEWIANCRDAKNAITLFHMSHSSDQYIVISAQPSVEGD